MTPAGIILMSNQEGYKPKIYYDTLGNRSIGIGTNLENGITLKQAMALLGCELDDIAVRLNTLAWYQGLDSIRQDVIQNMAYNMGVNGVLEFGNMILALQRKDWEAASAAMGNSKWAMQVPNRVRELQTVMVSGSYAGVINT